MQSSDAILHVTDLGSLNGTFIDDIRVDKGVVVPGQNLRFGGVSFLATGDDADLISALSAEETDGPPPGVGQNGRSLSEAQSRVLELLVRGLSEKSIAQQLYLSKHTVHSHTKSIFKAFNVHSRAELLASFLKSPTLK